MKRLVCVGWCDADDVINYGQILQALSMMIILRRYINGKIVFASYLKRSVLSKLFYVKGHLGIKNGHFKSYLKTRKTINRIKRDNNVKLIQVQSYSRLKKVCSDADILICGSDQIWHPQNYDAGFFLECGNTTASRISYAASIPKTKVEPQFKKTFDLISQCLKKMDFISVREERSIATVSALSGKKVTSVLDPTFLVDKNLWESCIEKIETPEKYIFIYVPNGMNRNFVNIVKKIKEQKGIQRILVMMTRGENLFPDSDSLQYVSVGQFLWLIKNAECIITSSFHAVVFSTVFEKVFWCYDVPNEQRGEDIRMLDILEKLDLSERLLDEKVENIATSDIDYSAVHSHINQLRISSFDYLNNSLSLLL